MPSVTFVLPHWLYWSGLIVFPIVAMILSRRGRPDPTRRHLSIAYFLWLVAGFIGIHRFYVRSLWGMLYWPLFALILFSSAMERDARVAVTDAVAAHDAIVASIERTERKVTKAEQKLEADRTALATLTEEQQLRRKQLERRIKRNEKTVSDGRAKLAELKAELTGIAPRREAAMAERERWARTARWAFYAILAFLALDAVLLPGMIRRANERLAANPEPMVETDRMADDWQLAGSGWTGWIDRLSLVTGEFVSFWAVIAVFAYYYEVMVRYVFNSPTNWVHESMFLMFGMQYLIAGAYALLTESHVRVDIFYARFSPRGKALSDLLTSVFFFIFAGTLLVTGWIFASDSIAQREVSFTEWAIQYWPVKCTIVIGAALLLLQGIAKFARDLRVVITGAEA